ncbi:MAG: ABC-type transporter, periplasmic subunit [Desulfotomaculum sp. 46_296]|nr:MAG: ABC-type transporter, periplasmic subunit [Desulfotomaculum sp. 46_296]
MRRILIPAALFLALYFVLRGFAHPSEFFKTKSSQLVYLRQENCLTLDPARAEDQASAGVILNIFEGLVRFAPGSAKIQPCLAESWEVSGDGMSWTFKLRPGVAFQDGAPFNAQAVKFSIDRQMKKNADSSITEASLIYGMVRSVNVVDNLTVRFDLEFPYAPFLNNLAVPFAAPVVSPAAFKKYGQDFWLYPSGTGPYILKRWNRGREVVLRANPGYWGKKPSINEIIFRFEPSGAKRLKLLSDGRADVIEGSPDLNFSALAGKGFQVSRITGMDISYLGFYTNKSPFNDPKVRRAACLSIDRQELVKTIFKNGALLADGPLPPGILAYGKDTKQYTCDLKQARELLKEAGYPNGLKITLLCYSNPRPYNPAGGRELARYLSGQLNRAGFQVVIVSSPWDRFKEALSRQEGDAFIYGWTCENCDPDNFLYTLFSSAQIANYLNSTRYSNQKVDTLLVTAQRIEDPDLRTRLYREAQQQLFMDAPALFLNHSLNVLLSRQEVRGLTPQPGGLVYLNSVSKTKTKNKL